MQISLEEINSASEAVCGRGVGSINQTNIFLHINTGKAAFLSTTQYHNAKAQGLLASANHHGSLETACNHCNYSAPIQPYNRDDHDAKTREGLLDTLVPLNELAAVELSDEYEKLGTFRPLDDLINRLPRQFQFQKLLQAAE